MPVDTVIFSGDGPHADPWHPLAETSATLATLIGDPGSVTIVTSVDQLDAALDGARLLVVNASANRSTPIPEDEDFARILDGFLARGGSLLATHSATLAFPQVPSWRSAVGAAWEHGRSFHPPIGPSLVRRSGVEHPISTGLGDFEVFDERYTDLELIDGVDVEPLYVHDEGGATHPLVWARTVGSSRIVYSALGHDARSYESPEHVELLRRVVSWLRHDS
ncbi:type 1 glutamine amidotransferase [Micromonospora luteifusca]|uniref:Type 1 glutamine amidotransferase n=1 Tax=Micromonospora luteifusca TaxID=709860 RepID=A0ABS2M2N7_9ACTN|nr:ThuA domain-containing protein [Micromonospora luteifusca]MBM7494714.1 type 1 glutamine amidotransferase [Micromonospora luteifusca]